MAKYEVWGVGYNKDGILTNYFKRYGEFDAPAEAMLFAHSIDDQWLKEHGELGNTEYAVDVSVELCVEDYRELSKDTALWRERIDVYHKMNSGLLAG